MVNKKAYFTPSTNLNDDIGNKDLLDNIIVTKQIVTTLKLYLESEQNINNSAVSIIGPYGGGKSTTALVLYHYLTNSLSSDLEKKINKHSIDIFKPAYKRSDVKIVVGSNTSLEKSLIKFFKIRTSLVKHIREKYVKKGNRLVLIIDEFGKYLEYSSDDPRNGDVYVLQELAEMASRSNGIFKIITIRHQAIMGYFSGMKGSFLNEWKKIQGRFHDVIHSNSIEDTFDLIAPHVEKFSARSVPVPAKIRNMLNNNSSIGDLSKITILKNGYPFHPFSILLLVSAYKRFAQNERSIFTFLNTNERHGINHFLSDPTDEFYSLSEFYEYIFKNLSHYIIESSLYQEWNKIEVAIRDLRSSNNKILVDHFDMTEKVIKTIGMLNLFGSDIGLKADKETIALGISYRTDKRILNKIFKIIEGLNKDNIVTKNSYQGGSFHLWHGAHTNINELIHATIKEQKGSLDLGKHLERLSPNDPIIAKKHLIQKGSFRSIELRYQSIDELKSTFETVYDGVIYIHLVKSTYQKDKTEKVLKNHKFKNNERAIVFWINPKTEDYIRQFVATTYIEQNHQQLKTDKVGRDELLKTKFHLSQHVESLIRNHKVLKLKIYSLDRGKLRSIDYQGLSTDYIDDWMNSLYSATPIVKNELINVVKPSPSAMVGVKKLLFEMLRHPHLENFGIETNGPEKSIYLNVIKSTGLHKHNGKKYELSRPSEPGLIRLWDVWDEMIKGTRDDNDTISIAKLIEKASESPFGLKTGLAHILAIIKVFSELDQISLYHKRLLSQEYMYIAKIEKDTIELITKRPENFELKFVDSKMHQSFFSELYYFLNQDQKDITTLLDVARSIIEKVSLLRDRTIKTRKGISEQAQHFIREVRDARSPEDLIYVKIPNSLDLEPITSSKGVASKIYVTKLQSVLDEIHKFEANIFPFIKEQLIGLWELGISSRSSIGDTKFALSKKVDILVLNWVFDEKVKEFVKRVVDKDRNGGVWLASVAGHLVGKLPEKWSDDDVPVFIDQLRFMKIQYEEAEFLYVKNRALNERQNIDTSKVEKEFDKLVNSMKLSDEEKQLAILRIYNRHVRKEEKN